jgi:hypothetical protein
MLLPTLLLLLLLRTSGRMLRTSGRLLWTSGRLLSPIMINHVTTAPMAPPAHNVGQ